LNRRMFVKTLGVAFLPQWPSAPYQNLTVSAEQTPLIEAAAGQMVAEYARYGTTAIDGPISWLQRRLRLGYRRAVDLVDELEGLGVWSRLDGTQRTILIPARFFPTTVDWKAWQVPRGPVADVMPATLIAVHRVRSRARLRHDWRGDQADRFESQYAQATLPMSSQEGGD
jgi:hypothetical protein